MKSKNKKYIQNKGFRKFIPDIFLRILVCGDNNVFNFFKGGNLEKTLGYHGLNSICF